MNRRHFAAVFTVAFTFALVSCWSMVPQAMAQETIFITTPQIRMAAGQALRDQGAFGIQAYGKPKAVVLFGLGQDDVKRKMLDFLQGHAVDATAVVATEKSPPQECFTGSFLVDSRAVAEAQGDGAIEVLTSDRPDATSRLPVRYAMPPEGQQYPFFQALVDMIGFGPRYAAVTNSTPYCIEYTTGPTGRVAFLSRDEFAEMVEIINSGSKNYDLSDYEADPARQPQWLLAILVLLLLALVIIILRRRGRHTARKHPSGDLGEQPVPRTMAPTSKPDRSLTEPGR